MPYRRIGVLLLLVGVLWLLYRTLHLDPVRTGLACLLLYGGYRLLRSRAPGRRTTLTGVVRLMDREYHLQGLDLACGLADVKIDLSRAIIPAGEHLIRVRGLVGSVDIYVPYDLEVSVTAAVPVGALHVMNTGRKGPGPRGVFVTGGYAEAANKVKIDISLMMGDVSVRCL